MDFVYLQLELLSSRDRLLRVATQFGGKAWYRCFRAIYNRYRQRERLSCSCTQALDINPVPYLSVEAQNEPLTPGVLKDPQAIPCRWENDQQVVVLEVTEVTFPLLRGFMG